jgi:hypothetical protein
MKTAVEILKKHLFVVEFGKLSELEEEFNSNKAQVDAILAAMEEYANQSKEPHDCHGKGYECRESIIYCRECNEPLFEIIGCKNQKHL